MRRAGCTNTQIGNNAENVSSPNGYVNLSSCDDMEIARPKIHAQLNAGNYLGAMSIFFETLVKQRNHHRPSKKDREKLAAFVDLNFPESIEVEITVPDLSPAEERK